MSENTYLHYRHNSFNGEENQEYNELKNDVGMNEENNVMYNSLIKPGFIYIEGKPYQYGKQIREQDESLLGVLEKGYTLEKLCQDIIENQKYLSSKEKDTDAVKPSRIFQRDEIGRFLVPCSLIKVKYNPFNCYKMSNDKKVLYEYDEEDYSVISATYYDDNNNVYFTKNCEIINSLLLKHQVTLDDDVSIDDKNRISDNDKSNTIINTSKREDKSPENMNENNNNNLSGQNNDNQFNQNENKFNNNNNSNLPYKKQEKPSNNSDRCWNNLKWLDCCGLCRDK